MGAAIRTKLSLFPNRMKQNPLLILWAFLALPVIICSCSSTKDVSRDPEKHTDFRVGQTVQLGQDVFLDKATLFPMELLPFPKSNGSMPSWIEGTVKSGTKLKITRISFHYSPMAINVTDVFAQIISGEFSGRVVNVAWISERNSTTGYTKRNPKYLERIEDRS